MHKVITLKSILTIESFVHPTRFIKNSKLLQLLVHTAVEVRRSLVVIKVRSPIEMASLMHLLLSSYDCYSMLNFPLCTKNSHWNLIGLRNKESAQESQIFSHLLTIFPVPIKNLMHRWNLACPSRETSFQQPNFSYLQSPTHGKNISPKIDAKICKGCKSNPANYPHGEVVIASIPNNETSHLGSCHFLNWVQGWNNFQRGTKYSGFILLGIKYWGKVAKHLKRCEIFGMYFRLK